MAKRLYVNCKDYNGFKNVKFVMYTDDFNWHNTIGDEPNYEKIADVDVKNDQFNFNGKLYIVHSDWSVEKSPN